VKPHVIDIHIITTTTTTNNNNNNTGASNVCTIIRNNRMAATLFPKDTVCLRNISVNTLHDDDDNEVWCDILTPIAEIV
jgi:hypothetical protein